MGRQVRCALYQQKILWKLLELFQAFYLFNAITMQCTASTGSRLSSQWGNKPARLPLPDSGMGAEHPLGDNRATRNQGRCSVSLLPVPAKGRCRQTALACQDLHSRSRNTVLLFSSHTLGKLRACRKPLTMHTEFSIRAGKVHVRGCKHSASTVH